MNLKKLFLTAGILASVNTPTVVAQEFDLAEIFSSINFEEINIGQLLQTAIGEFTNVLPALIETATTSLAAIVEGGFTLDVIIEQITAAAVNVGAIVVAAVTNVAFVALGPQISQFVQGFVAEYDPLDVTELLFEDGWTNTTEDGDCLGFSYIVEEAEVVGFSKAEITAFKILDQEYIGGSVAEEEDGQGLFMHATAAVGEAAVDITMSGMVKEVNCDDPEEDYPTHSFDAQYLLDNAKGSAEFKLEAIVEGQNFNISSATFIEVDTETDDLVMTVTGDDIKDDIKTKLGDALAAKVNVYVDLFLKEADNITSINDSVSDFLPFGFELPFAWPLP